MRIKYMNEEGNLTVSLVADAVKAPNKSGHYNLELYDIFDNGGYMVIHNIDEYLAEKIIDELFRYGYADLTHYSLIAYD